MNLIEEYYMDQEEPNRSCLLALRNFILTFDEEITEEWKWKMPFFCFRKKYFCYLYKNKKTPSLYLAMTQGKHIEHSELSFGQRTQIKVFHIDPNEDIDFETIAEILTLGMEYYRSK